MPFSAELVFEAVDVAFAQSDTPIATHLEAEETDVPVAVAGTFTPKERVVRLDAPESLVIAVLYQL